MDKNKQKKDGKSEDKGRQTDLAEGELDTVEESLRIHEEKGDLPPDPAPEKGGRRDPAKRAN